MGVEPTAPGIPESASMPARPWSTACATSSSQSSPAATVSTTPPHWARASTSQVSVSASTPVVATWTTRPSNPSSDTTRLEPPASSSTGVPAASASATAATSSASVVARTHSRPGPPRRRVVWSRRSGTDGGLAHHGLGHAEHLLALARHLERERDHAVGHRLHGAADDHVGATLGGYDDGAGELRPEVDDLGAAGPLGDRAADEREGVHAVGDHAGEADAARDVLVLVDRVVVAAGVGIGDEVGASDREGQRLEDVTGVHAAPPDEWTRVALPVQTTAPVASVISLVVAMMSAPPIWRSPVTVSVALSSSPIARGRTYAKRCSPWTMRC